MKRRRPPLNASVAGSSIVLGLVVLPEAGRLSQALETLKNEPDCEVADPHGHRIPVVLECSITQDEARLAQLRDLPFVMSIDVAYAELSGDKETE